MCCFAQGFEQHLARRGLPIRLVHIVQVIFISAEVRDHLAEEIVGTLLYLLPFLLLLHFLKHTKKLVKEREKAK